MRSEELFALNVGDRLEQGSHRYEVVKASPTMMVLRESRGLGYPIYPFDNIAGLRGVDYEIYPFDNVAGLRVVGRAMESAPATTFDHAAWVESLAVGAEVYAFNALKGARGEWQTAIIAGAVETTLDRRRCIPISFRPGDDRCMWEANWSRQIRPASFAPRTKPSVAPEEYVSDIEWVRFPPVLTVDPNASMLTRDGTPKPRVERTATPEPAKPLRTLAGALVVNDGVVSRWGR